MKRLKMYTALCVCCFAAACTFVLPGFGQTNTLQFGVTAYGALNFIPEELQAFPDVPFSVNASLLRSRGGFDMAMGADLEYHLTQTIGFRLQTDIYWVSSRLGKSEINDGSIDGPNPPTSFDKLLDIRELSVGITPELNLRFGSWRVFMGYRFGFRAASELILTETILDPTDAVFPDGSNERVLVESELPEFYTVASHILTGVEYNLALNAAENLWLHPGMEVRTNPSGSEIEATVVSFGARLRWLPFERRELVRDTLYMRDTLTRFIDGITAERVELTTSATDAVIDDGDDGSERLTIRIRESYTLQAPKDLPLAIAAVDARLGGDEHNADTLRIVLRDDAFGAVHIPPIDFETQAYSETEILEWYLTVTDRERDCIAALFSGAGVPPAIIEWHPFADGAAPPEARLALHLDYALTLRIAGGQDAVSPLGTIRLRVSDAALLKP